MPKKRCTLAPKYLNRDYTGNLIVQASAFGRLSPHLSQFQNTGGPKCILYVLNGKILPTSSLKLHPHFIALLGFTTRGFIWDIPILIFPNPPPSVSQGTNLARIRPGAGHELELSPFRVEGLGV